MFKKEISKCSECDCGGERLIVNRTKWLCEQKNRERLDKGRVKKAPKAMRNHSKKRSKIESEYAKVRDVLLQVDSVCNNCGTPERLSFSHLVPRSRRPDLIATKSNIVFHCMSFDGKKGCHESWEEGDTTMNDYKSNMEKVRELDEEYYNLLKMKHK